MAFAQVPMSVVMSSFLSDPAVELWTYLRSFWTDEDGFTEPMKLNDVAAVLGKSRSTVNRAKRLLKRYGFMEVRSEGRQGLRFKLSDRADVRDDFGAFGEKYPYLFTGERFAVVTRDMVTHGPRNPKSLRLWTICDSIAGDDRAEPETFGWAHATRSEIASWIRAAPDTVSDHARELQSYGLLEIEEGPGGTNRYRPHATLQNPKARYVPPLEARKRQAAEEGRKQAAAEQVRESPEDGTGVWELAKDLSVYWFTALGDLEWAVRNAQTVYHLQTYLRIFLLELKPDTIKAHLDDHLAVHGDSVRPEDLIPLLGRFLTRDGRDFFNRVVDHNNELFQATHAALGPRPEAPDGVWLTDHPDDSAYHEDLFEPAPADEEPHPTDTANRSATYR